MFTHRKSCWSFLLCPIIILFSFGCSNFDLSNTIRPKPISGDLANTFIMPPGPSHIDPPIPQKVIEAQKSEIRILINFYRYPNGIGNSLEPIPSGGTGFLIATKSGPVILSARHVLMDPIIDLSRYGMPFILNNNKIPLSHHYSYIVYGIRKSDPIPEVFNLTPIAMGELGKHQDWIFYTTQAKLENMKPLKFAESDPVIGEYVFVSGYAPVESPFPNTIGTYEYVLSSIINDTFTGPIVEIIENMPINKVGLKRKYRIKIGAERGYSGSPILNKNGEVIGLLTEGTKNFYFAVSSKDLKLFIANIENNKPR